MDMNDSQTISAVLQGDKNSYEMLVEKHKKMVYGIAWSRLGDSDLSEDAAQETFIKAYTYLGTLREPHKFQGWLARIARNVCTSLGRRAKRDDAFKQRWAVLESSEAEPHCEERESLAQQLWESFADLSAQHREALTIFYIEGKSVDEAAAALGITETTLKTRLHRARAALRRQLEQKLEDSLADLKPSKGFTRSVLVLLPLSPKSATGTGIVAMLGKLFASLSFALWMAAAQTLPILGIYSLISRVEESSFEDVPENKPIKALIRRGYMKAVVGMFAGFVIAWLLILHFGQMTAMQIITVGYGCLTIVAVGAALAKRRVGANTPASIINVAMWGIMFTVLVAIGFYHTSIILFPIAILVTGIMSLFVTPKTPQTLQHIGTNPFIQHAFGRGEVPEADLILDRTLSKLELQTFVRLLGTLGIVRDYRFRGDTIYVMLTGMKPHKLAGLGLVAGDSDITISPDGACAARISYSDLKVARETFVPNATAEKLQDEACRAIRYALKCFAGGDAQAGLDSLSVTTEGSGRAQSPAAIRNHRVRQFITVWFGIVVLVQFTSHSAIAMIVASVVGFLGAGLALAITLYINKRQNR